MKAEHEMKILVDNSGYHLRNLGDAAMLQVGVSRLRGLWPRARINVLTLDPQALRRLCPEAEPVPAKGKMLFNALGNIIPGALKNKRSGLAARLSDMYSEGLSVLPRGGLALAKLRGAFKKIDTGVVDEFFTAVSEADAVVSTGGGFVNDEFEGHALETLALLRMAQRMGKPTAMFGQGLGPITSARLHAAAMRVLPRLSYLGLRERLGGEKLLNSVGGAPRRCLITGDDAIELALQANGKAPGSAIGLNVRVAAYSGVSHEDAVRIAGVVTRTAGEAGVGVVPFSISIHDQDSDLNSLRLCGLDVESGGASRAQSPADVIDVIGQCAVVVTGSYHGAVLALSQGIPVVALAKSAYYRAKFDGVADMFPGGAEVVLLDSEYENRLENALGVSLGRASLSREALSESARMQVRNGQAGYAMFKEIVDSRSGR